ncbi:MAG: adenine-specific methyltransferase EcoRI family protein [Patescibacteria group bacterium]
MANDVEIKSLNKNLHKASKAKNDEFYTQLGDIANELRHYRDQLRGKIVLCNCDDPFESNFFKFFAANFNTLGLKKLIATSYLKSPIVGIQLPLLDIEGLKPDGEEPYVVEINEVPDLNKDGAISLDDVEHLLKHNKNIATPLKGNGDFRSTECIELLKQADIVCTNPPFSLFREFVAQLIEYDKKFLIIGSKNAITYKEIFKLIKDNKLWLGYGFAGGNAYFKIPPEKSRDFAAGVYDPSTGLVKFRNVGWFTNLYVDKSEDPITPYLTYEQGLKKGLYPKYDNYDAIEVSKIAEIPSDYDGVMGVPITFLDKWVPESEIEIVKFRKGNDDKDLAYTREREREREREYNRTSEYSFVIVGQTGVIEPDGICIQYKAGRPYIKGQRKYARLFIKQV